MKRSFTVNGFRLRDPVGDKGLKNSPLNKARCDFELISSQDVIDHNDKIKNDPEYIKSKECVEQSLYLYNGLLSDNLYWWFTSLNNMEACTQRFYLEDLLVYLLEDTDYLSLLSDSKEIVNAGRDWCERKKHRVVYSRHNTRTVFGDGCRWNLEKNDILPLLLTKEDGLYALNNLLYTTFGEYKEHWM